MSAGTRSRAMTATAPASSAILACSAVTTSMMTPPLSISAMPRLTRVVPVGPWRRWSAAGVLPEVGVVLTMSCFPVIWSRGRSSRVGPRDACGRRGPARRAGAAGWSARARGAPASSSSNSTVCGIGRVAREVEHADDPLAAHPAHVGDGVVVEPPGQLHAGAGRGRAGRARPAPSGVDRSVLRRPRGQGEVERLGEVVLGELACLARARRAPRATPPRRWRG